MIEEQTKLVNNTTKRVPVLPPKSKNIYSDNTKLCAAIMHWRVNRDKKSYEYIGKQFILIATNQLRLPCFINYSKDRKTEMISDALYLMSKKLPKYDPSYIPNPFSYFTQTAYRAYQQRLNIFKKRDSTLKSISHIENLEQKAFPRSTTINTRGTENG